jgi:uncharacterized delta-60 repeat protein
MQNKSFVRVEALELRTLMSAGDLDPMFGSGGNAVVTFGQDMSANPRQLLRRGDGSLAVLGDLFGSTPHGVIANFTAGGLLDPQYASNPEPLMNGLPSAVAVQADGKLVIVTTQQNTSRDLFVYRLNTDGSIDPSFNATGQEMIDVGGSTDDSPLGVGIQSDGGIVIAGSLTPAGNPSPSVQKLFVIRLSAAGARDLSFGQSGLVTMQSMTFNNNPLTIDAANNIVLQASALSPMGYENLMIARLNAEGQPDMSFNGGVPFISNNANTETPGALTILPGGNILSALQLNGSDEEFLMLRSDGTLNSGYGMNGVFGFGNPGDQVTSLGVDSGGRIVAGYGMDGVSQVERFLPDAITPDATFGVNGKVVVSNVGSAPGKVVVVPADNSIFYSHTSGNDFIVTRLLGDAGATNPPPPDLQPPTNNPGGTSTPNIVANFPGLMSPLTIGGTAQVGIYLSYFATTSTSIDANIYLSSDSIGGNPDDILIGHFDAVPVAPNTSGVNIGTATVQIPASLPEGNYYLVETVDPNNLLAEASETDNTAITQMPFPVVQPGSVGTNGTKQDSGFDVSNARVNPTNVPAGGAFTFSANLTNNTGVALPERQYKIYLSPRPMLGANDVFLATITFPAQDNGTTIPFSVSGTVPPQTVPAAYFFSGIPVDSTTSGGDTGGTTKMPVLNVTAAPVKPGSLNSNFGAGGVAQNTVQAKFTAVDSVLDSRNRIVVVGTQAGSGFVLVRFNTDGSIDSTFGVNGIEQIMIGPDDRASAITIDPSGKFLIAGTSQGNFTVLRCNADGSPDMSFGDNGHVMTDLAPLFGAPGSRDVSKEIAVRGDGKIYVVGTTDARDAGDFAIVRYNANGTLDTSFGSGGAAAIDFGQSLDSAHTIAIQHDGNIVVAGSATVNGVVQIAVVRLLNNGALDPHFGTAGRVTFTGVGNDSEINAIRTQSDGKLVLGGFYAQGSASDGTLTTNFYLARLDTLGRLDPHFGAGGQMRTTIPNIALASIDNLIVTPEGKIVVAGKTAATITDANGGNVGVAVARYTAGGQLDTTFNSTGYLLLFQPTSVSGAAASALPTLAAASSDLSSAFSSFTSAAAGLVNLTPAGGILALATSTTDSTSSDDSSDSSSSSGTTTVSIASIVADGADLVSSLATSKIPSSVITGASGVVTLTVENEGSLSIKGSVPLTLYLSTSSIHSSGDHKLLSTKLAVSLAPGKSAKFTLKITFPKNIANGDYFILADLNATGSISELSTTNDDSSSSSTTEVAKPFVNLSVAYAKNPPSTITAGKTAPVALLITDTGNLAASGKITGKLIASTDGSIDSSDTTLSPFTMGVSLQPGKSVKLTIMLKLTSSLLPPESAFLAAVLNYAGKQKDSNSLDNTVFSNTQLTFT